MSASERKSMTPMASHLSKHDEAASNANYHSLQQFITYSDWDVAPMERLLSQRADAMLGGPDAVLIVDDTALKKQGKKSVGVAHQYCGEVGKLANCQCLVTLTLANGEVPIPVALRLYLPAEWTEDAERCAGVGVPEAVRLDQYNKTKIGIALDEIRRVREAGVRFGLVAADAAYGTSAEFRHGVQDLGYRYAVGVQSHTRVYPVEATILYPQRPLRERTGGARYQAKQPRRITSGHAGANSRHYPIGRLRVRPVASEPSHSVAELLSGAHWQNVRWRNGTKGVLSGKWTAIRVRAADGAEGKAREHMPGEAVWLVGEQRPDGKRRYYFTNHPARTSLLQLVRAIRSRWVCEQGHQQLKQEFGLDHFEGRSWRGLEHHSFLTMLSFAFLQYLRLKGNRLLGRAGSKKNFANTEGRSSTVTFTPRGPACPHCNALLNDALLSSLFEEDHLPSAGVKDVHK
jgi:SRSO17 transposase